MWKLKYILNNSIDIINNKIFNTWEIFAAAMQAVLKLFQDLPEILN